MFVEYMVKNCDAWLVVCLEGSEDVCLSEMHLKYYLRRFNVEMRV